MMDKKRSKTGKSQKDLFVDEMQRLIITGKLGIGEKLLPERELAEKMGVSRVVARNGLQELCSNGLVTIISRKGTYVNNFIVEGTLSSINLLLKYDGRLNRRIAESLLNLRFLLEEECVRLAAEKRTDEDIKKIGIIILKEELVDKEDYHSQTNIDFEFHHTIAVISKNIMYPAIIKTLETTFKAYVYEFMEKTGTYSDIFKRHRKIYEAIKKKSAQEAVDLMHDMLEIARVLIEKVNLYQLESNNKKS